MADVNEIRKQFPALGMEVYGKKFVYLDNAATSQRPASVVSLQSTLSTQKNANIHRAVHFLSGTATAAFENTRAYVRDFIGASSSKEIIFTSGTTASINLVAFSFGEAFVSEGDEIIVCESEHHSNLVPWQMMCQRKGAVLRCLPVDDSGAPDIDVLKAALCPKTKLLAIAQISNVLGLVNPIKEIIEICHSSGCAVLVDGAQGIVHERPDVSALGCDFYAFSGHKIYAATGTGVLYGRRELLEQMPPYMGGGEMIGSVKFSGTTYADLPQKFEAGTQNFNSIPTLVPALEMAGTMDDREIREYYDGVGEYVYKELLSRENIKLYGVPRGTLRKVPIFSFTVEGAHHEDIANILDKMGIAVRSGQMCAEPVMDRYGVTGMVRASFAPYNTLEEAKYFIESLDRAIGMLS